jgi:hypothetical protein
MCNKLHNDSIPIEESGIAYKIFSRQSIKKSKTGEKRLFKMTESSFNIHSIFEENTWIKWDSKLYYDQDGFCFLLTKEEAELLATAWSFWINTSEWVNTSETKFEIRKIEYKNGLGKHLENGIIEKRPFLIALCKDFKIGELVKTYLGGKNV